MQRLEARAHLVEPVVPGHALADEPALQIGERDEHRVDLAVGYQVFELARVQHPSHRHDENAIDYSGVT